MNGTQRTHMGHPSPNDIAAVDEILDNIEPVLAPVQERLRAHKGRHAETTLKAFIGYCLLNDLAGNASTLANVLRVAKGLQNDTRTGWGDTSPEQTYKRLHQLFSRLMRLLGEAEPGELSEMDQLINSLIETQLDATGIDFGTTEAADGTVFRTPARKRYSRPTPAQQKWNVENGRDPHTRIAWTIDEDAALGHYPAKDGQVNFAVGYEAHLFTPVPEEGNDMPIVASAVTVQPNTTASRVAMRDLAIRIKDRVNTLIFDAGYDRTGESSFQILHDHGISPIFDPNKKLRHGKAPSHGKLIIDGDEFCPQMPKGLRNLPDFAKNLAPDACTNLEARYAERDRYRFEPVAYGAKTVRSMCPAWRGTVKCTGVPHSLNNPKVDIVDVEVSIDPPKCCTQRTTSTPRRLLRRSRQGRYPYGTAEWLRLYGQRNRVESYNADFRHNIGNFEERKWCAVMGRVKLTFLLGIKLLTTNMRKIENFKQDTR